MYSPAGRGGSRPVRGEARPGIAARTARKHVIHPRADAKRHAGDGGDGRRKDGEGRRHHYTTTLAEANRWDHGRNGVLVRVREHLFLSSSHVYRGPGGEFRRRAALAALPAWADLPDAWLERLPLQHLRRQRPLYVARPDPRV